MRTSDIITITQAVNYTKKAINNLGETTSHKDLLSTYGRRKVWFNFEDELWSPRISGQVIEDTENVRYGSRGMKIVYTGEYSWAQTTFPVLDLSNKIVMLSLYIDNIEDIYDPVVRFRVNGSWDNTIIYTIDRNAPYFSDLKTGWNLITLSNYRFGATGTADADSFKNVDGMRIMCKSGTPGAYITVDQIWLIDKPKIKEPLFTITLDDGYVSQYTVARPLMSKYDYRGVCYVISSSVGRPGRMSIEQLKILYQMGWDISNHTATHKPAHTTPAEEWIADMKAGYDWLVENGFQRSAGHLAYPGGHNTVETLWSVQQYHKTGRLNMESKYGNTLPPANPYLLRVYPILTSTSISTVKNRIDENLERGQWLIFMFHGIDEDTSGSGWVTPAFFEEFIEYLAEKNAKVVTMSDMVN